MHKATVPAGSVVAPNSSIELAVARLGHELLGDSGEKINITLVVKAVTVQVVHAAVAVDIHE